jgi:hypothetical protein
VKYALAILLLAVQSHAAKMTSLNGWIACDINGKSVPLYRETPDSVTCDVPHYVNVVSFLTHSTGTLTGKTISLTLYIEASPDVLWTGGQPGGCPPLPTMRLYFTRFAGAFSLNNSHRYSTSYWWNHSTGCTVESVDDGSLVTLTATLDPSDWSGAWGESASAYLADFSYTAANAKQVGLAFGNGCFYDTGVAVSQGSATIHVLSLTVQ